jgi:hypothetical protein
LDLNLKKLSKESQRVIGIIILNKKKIVLNFLNKLIPDKSHPRDKEMIEIFDSTGCRLQVPFKEWRTKFLPENIEASWNNADALAKWVWGGLRDGLSQDIEKASEYLMEIDSNAERAICFRANVLMDLKKYKEMEGVVADYLKRNPKTGVVLTNLAKAQNFLGKKEFMITLEEALKLDPNQENGLLWWASLYNESARKGLTISDESAYLMGITEAERKFGGWKAKQYLGSFFANQKQKEVAIHWFEKALQEKDWSHDLLMSITGDLGKNGFIEDVLKIVEPIYQPDQYNFFTGKNLLQCYLESKQIDKGQKLLDKMFALRDMGTEQSLLWYQSQFNKITGEAKITPNDSMQNDIALSSIDSPLWTIGVGGKKTGFEFEKTGKKIGLIQFFKNQGEIKEATFGIEDKVGSIARAIQLYLFEDIYYGSDASATFIFPTIKNTSYALLQGVETDWLQTLAKNGGFDGVFCGQISEVNNTLTLIYFDSLKNLNRSQVVNNVDLHHPGKWMPIVEEFFFEVSAIEFDQNFSITNKGFKRITGELLNNYFGGLTQRLTIALAGSNKNSDAIYGERNIIRWFLDEAGYYTDAMQCQLGMIGAIRQFINYNSSAAKEYQKEIKAYLEICSKKPDLKNLSHEVLDEFNRWLEEK